MFSKEVGIGPPGSVGVTYYKGKQEPIKRIYIMSGIYYCKPATVSSKSLKARGVCPYGPLRGLPIKGTRGSEILTFKAGC